MPGPEVTRTNSQSDKQPLYSSMDGEADKSESSASVGKARQNSGKTNASPASAIPKPNMRTGEKKRSPSKLSSASIATEKSQGSSKGKVGKGASPNRKSSSANHSSNQEKMPLVEFDDSWEASEEESVASHQTQGQINISHTSRMVKKTSQPVLRTTGSPDASPLIGKASTSTVMSAEPATGHSGSPVESSPNQTSDVVSPSRTGNQTASGPAKATVAGTVSTVRRRASMPNASQPPAKPARDQTYQDFVSVKEVEKLKAKAVKETKQQQLQRLTPDTVARMDTHKADLIALMTGEDTNKNAEALYRKVARICTDKKLENWQKLNCLRGEAGNVCMTLTKDVNAYFEAWVIQLYVDNHLPDAKGERKQKQGIHSNAKGDRESLLSDDENKNDDGNMASDKDSGGNSGADYDQNRVLEKFKSTLNWWERKKLEKIQPEEKFAKDPARKAVLQRIELLRKMQKRLTAEERRSIREDTKKYHDLLANSGLPVLHIAVKNESCNLVKAYLLAVMAFAPFDIKKEAIQATQHQGLQAFYWAMTHSTTDMIKTFMETVLYSDFLFCKEMQTILHARRPDPQKGGIYGISGFYMAMASGDLARADAFMSQLLQWDPNCRFHNYSEIKIDLLEAFRSKWLKHKAKGAAVENGHKKLVEAYNDYVHSSHLRRIEKDLLYIYNRIRHEHEQEQYVQFSSKEEMEEAEKLIQKVCETFDIKMPREGGDLPEDVEMAPGVPMQGYTKIHQTIAYERKASILKIKGKPIPEHLQKFYIKDFARRPFENVNKAGGYARLSTIPQPIPPERRRTDGDHLIGRSPALSKEARGNSWQERKENHTLPPRSSSYASGLVDLPPMPASMPALSRLDELSPAKLTPSPKRRSSHYTGLPNGTPTRLVSKKLEAPLPNSTSASTSRKNFQKPQSGTGSDSVSGGLGTSVPS